MRNNNSNDNAHSSKTIVNRMTCPFKYKKIATRNNQTNISSFYTKGNYTTNNKTSVTNDSYSSILTAGLKLGYSNKKKSPPSTIKGKSHSYMPVKKLFIKQGKQFQFKLLSKGDKENKTDKNFIKTLNKVHCVCMFINSLTNIITTNIRKEILYYLKNYVPPDSDKEITFIYSYSSDEEIGNIEEIQNYLHKTYEYYVKKKYNKLGNYVNVKKEDKKMPILKSRKFPVLKRKLINIISNLILKELKNTFKKLLINGLKMQINNINSVRETNVNDILCNLILKKDRNIKSVMINLFRKFAYNGLRGYTNNLKHSKKIEKEKLACLILVYEKSILKKYFRKIYLNIFISVSCKKFQQNKRLFKLIYSKIQKTKEYFHQQFMKFYYNGIFKHILSRNNNNIDIITPDKETIINDIKFKSHEHKTKQLGKILTIKNRKERKSLNKYFYKFYSNGLFHQLKTSVYKSKITNNVIQDIITPQNDSCNNTFLKGSKNSYESFNKFKFIYLNYQRLEFLFKKSKFIKWNIKTCLLRLNIINPKKKTKSVPKSNKKNHFQESLKIKRENEIIKNKYKNDNKQKIINY